MIKNRLVDVLVYLLVTLHLLELTQRPSSSVDKLNMLPDFANKFEESFMGINGIKIPSISPRQKIILTKETWKVPNKLHFEVSMSNHYEPPNLYFGK